MVTHCLYPSFERVRVFVTKFGDGYRVTDGGGAARCAWDHRRDAGMSKKLLEREARRYSVASSDLFIVAEASNLDWLYSAIIAVANASASAAGTADGKVAAAAEEALKDKIFTRLSHVFSASEIGTDFELPGRVATFDTSTAAFARAMTTCYKSLNSSPSIR